MRCIELVGLSVLLAALAIAQYPVPSQGGGGVGPPATQAFTSVQNAGTDVVCALHADVIAGLTCNNQVTDGTVATAFASTVSIPAGAMSANSTGLKLGIGYVSSGTAPTIAISVKLGSTVVYTSNSLNTNSLNTAIQFTCSMTAAAAASATTPIVAVCTAGAFSNGTKSTVLSTTSKSIAVDTTVAQTLSVTAIFGAATAGNAVWLYSIAP